MEAFTTIYKVSEALDFSRVQLLAYLDARQSRAATGNGKKLYVRPEPMHYRAVGKQLS